MTRVPRHKRLLFDLNHPADFHFFRNLLTRLGQEGYTLRVIARDKECLHQLLDHAGIPYKNRGVGSHSLLGKYLYAGYILLLTLAVMVRFRPGLTLSLSSPYVITVSRFLGVPTLAFDDTDDNPRLLPLISKADFLFSPISYPHHFHKNHFYIHSFKELAYLHPGVFQAGEQGDGVFFRITRTDSIHHLRENWTNQPVIIREINRMSEKHPTYLSSETSISPKSGHNTKGRNPNKKSELFVERILIPDTVNIHGELYKCKVFWGNSATMAAEAAVLGIPAIFVGEKKFAYLKELENYGLVFCYSPDQVNESFSKLKELLLDIPGNEVLGQCKEKMLSEKINITELLYWFVANLPTSAGIMRDDPGFQWRFRLFPENAGNS
jgi:predicted glycosyltransferase